MCYYPKVWGYRGDPWTKSKPSLLDCAVVGELNPSLISFKKNSKYLFRKSFSEVSKYEYHGRGLDLKDADGPKRTRMGLSGRGL